MTGATPGVFQLRSPRRRWAATSSSQAAKPRMPVVSSCYWNMVHGNKPEEVWQDKEGVQIMRILGHEMSWLLKSIEAGRKSGLSRPEPEEKIRTNFIR